MWNTLTNIDWVLDYRSDALTSVFLIFPFFASDIFYFGLVAWGYWFTGARFYRDLGILVGLSTLLSYGLKILFMIPRPAIPHLVDTQNTFGFPSGDVQIACTVWGLLALQFHKTWFWTLSGLMVTAIGLSRIYLGVHTPLDVIGGALIGIACLLGYQWYIKTRTYKKIGIDKPQLLGLLLVAFVIAYSAWMWFHCNPVWVLPAGALLGAAAALGIIGDTSPPLSFKRSYLKVWIASLVLVGLYGGLRFFMGRTLVELALKAALVSFSILYFIPFLFSIIERKMGTRIH